jgi:hypothetical protein
MRDGKQHELKKHQASMKKKVEHQWKTTCKEDNKNHQ